MEALHRKSTPVIVYAEMDSLVGPLVLGVLNNAVVFLGFIDHGRRADTVSRLAGTLQTEIVLGECGLLARSRQQLHEYFSGERREFDLPLNFNGTPFQTRVWQALTAIPYGETCSYSELAGRLGQPRAMRAVGAANGRNHIPIIVPCHRVINADGSLGGFSSGLWRKQKLLELEARTSALI
jgi:methylated-DNA-[protein]-cysteine S-methyltransferase